MGEKQPCYEADHLPPPTTKVNNAQSQISTSPYAPCHSASLRHKNNLANE